MAANGMPLHPIIEDEEEFLNDVEEYMKQRGVPFDREGKVAGRPAPLHQLFKIVLERGGYDTVSDTRMAWREICTNFSFPKAHDGAMSYQLKQLYYKNLAAYEIEKYWGEVPPPPSMLEHTTAKGGDVRKRIHGVMPIEHEGSNVDSEGMQLDSPQHTPKQEKSEPDDQGSATRYPSRLRQQPKPAQFYQPDPTPSRAVRTRSTHSPQPVTSYAHPSFTSSSSNPRDPNFKIENYEPRPSMPLTLRPLITPGSNPDVFYRQRALTKLAPIQRVPLPQDLLRYTLPKPTFDGPNIYVRCVQGLKSGIQREQEFALHHLVKVSHERGDKFKFEGFPTLAEALMEKAVEITELAFGVSFHVSYMDARGYAAENTVNAVHGTQGLSLKLADLAPLSDEGDVDSDDHVQKLEKINEAILVIRNMVTLEDNAVFLSKMALFKDLLVLLLNLPRQSRFDEARQYALDMAEMTTRYWKLSPGDELYSSLVRELDSGDRGKMIRALGAIYRFDAEADRVHPICDIPISVFENVARMCTLEDDELVEAVINLLYAWSAFPDEVATVMKESPNLLPSLTPRLVNLLTRGAWSDIHERRHVVSQRPPPATTATGPISIPLVPADLYQQMLQYQEPERSSRWLRCCFEEAPAADVTQISIWQAYQSRFMHNQHIAAAEFIKQVSATISGAQAQVVQGPQGSRFIIKGIRPRRVLVGIQGQPYYKCHWQITLPTPANYSGPPLAARETSCGTWHHSPEQLWKHLLSDHAKIPSTVDGKFQIKDVTVPEGGWTCKWVDCHQHGAINAPTTLARHFRKHLPETAEQNRDLIYKLAGERRESDQGVATVQHTLLRTSLDDKGYPIGIPFMSALLLRNLARYVGRHGGTERHRKDLMHRMFPPAVRDNLWYIFSRQATIVVLILDIINLIEKGEASEKKSVKPEGDESRSIF